ncbi:MAG: LysM peptidoglycan-binding domain-containing protein [Anaerolineae bacterium]|nr:LysM peptidoglycan-binding domain-containing protein [Anaerolineae bacterium]
MFTKNTSRIVLAALVTVLFAGMLPASADGVQPLGTVVNAYRLNVRSGPGADFPVVGQLVYDQQVHLVGRNAEASWVQLYGEVGSYWVNARYISTVYNIWNLPITYGTGGAPPYYGFVVNTDELNTRSGPGVAYPVVGRLQRSDGVYMDGRNSDASWVRLVSSAGSSWVNARYINTAYNIWSLPDLSGSTGDVVHVVQSGETLYRIAQRYGTTIDDLVRLNSLSNPRLIYTGQRLIIRRGAVAPPPSQRIHVVQAGETLYRIARYYGVDIYELARVNHILNLNRIRAGQQLVIP